MDTQKPIPFSLVRSYYLPNQADTSVIQELVSSSDKDIERLEAELSHIRKFNAFQRSLLAPIRKLPNEVLGVIFTHTLSGKGIDVGVRCGSIWDLLRVCVRWRDVLESSSGFWSKFKIRRIEVKPSTVVYRIQQCLKSSGVTPLSICLLPSSPSTLPLQVMEDVARHADRWLSFTVYTKVFLRALAKTDTNAVIFHQGLDQLRKLNIKGNQKDMVIFPFHYLWLASGLEEVRMKSISIFSAFPPLWTNIRKLKVTLCTGIQLQSIMRSVPQLEELTCIYYTSNTNKDIDSEQTIMLPSLRTINVSTVDVFPFWSICSVPLLTNFRLQNCLMNVGIFLAMIKTSTSIIKYLRLDFCAPDVILQILTQFRDVEELTLSIKPLNEPIDSLFRALMWNPPNSPVTLKLLPSLRKLEIKLKDFGDPNIAIFIMIIMDSRSTGSITKLAEKHADAPTPLLHLKCVVEMGPFLTQGTIDAYKNDVKEFGKKTGIEVEIVFMTDNGEEIEDGEGIVEYERSDEAGDIEDGNEVVQNNEDDEDSSEEGGEGDEDTDNSDEESSDDDWL
ncbi:hypothetical protein BDQ17DRAFT_1355057 [Cyathus striatus]|nr:hypothetical protein BDQ17DRAFT_1355057 [Cyathus striatus]